MVCPYTLPLKNEEVQMNSKVLVGALETLDLPELGLFGIKTRIDTGAQTSALHVDHIEFDEQQKTVKFEFHPNSHDVAETFYCSVQLDASRWVKSSNGGREQRYIISTLAVLGKLSWTIQISLTDRSNMSNLMLLGRQAMENQLFVDPSQEFLVSTNLSQKLCLPFAI
jgi:hypothetical protein